MNILRIGIKTSVATALMMGFQVGVRGMEMNSNLFLILGITAGANMVAETLGEMFMRDKMDDHQRNMVLEPVIAGAIMAGGFVAAGFTDFTNVKSLVQSVALMGAMNFASDQVGELIATV